MTQRPIKMRGNKAVPLQVNDVLTHPLAALESGSARDRWKYKFLRVIRMPIEGRPDSGRIMVENVMTGKRTDFYSMLFGVSFRSER